jgi:chromosomal replication initiation ATPase DnaA
MIHILDKILAEVSESFDVPISKIMSRAKQPRYAKPRQVCYLLARKQDIPLTSIGAYFDRHHTTVMYGVENIEAQLTPRQRDYIKLLHKNISDFRHKRKTSNAILNL